MKKIKILTISIIGFILLISGCTNKEVVEFTDEGVVLIYGEEINDSDFIKNLYNLKGAEIKYEYDEKLLDVNQPLKVTVTYDGKQYTKEFEVRIIHLNNMKVEYEHHM